MADIRDRAKEILKEVPEPPQQINSDGATAALFTKLTGGVTHATLVANWQKGGIMTSCNEFVGWYGAQLGSKVYLGRFDLETYLPKIDKAYSWVKSTKDVQPKYGDICRHTAFPVGISLDFDGDNWNHVDAGQGGPIRDKDTKELKGGHDVLKRTRGTKPYDFTKLQGWIDLDLYFSPNLSVHEWLPGWWKVIWRGQTYYYYFDRSHQVKWTQILPLNTSQPMLLANDTGTFVMDAANAVTIRWSATGSLEKFTKTLTSDDPLRGTWNGTEPLSATKM